MQGLTTCSAGSCWSAQHAPVVIIAALQQRQPVRPLDVLCEAKVSAASPTFIKCSCEACTGGASGYAGGSFNSVKDFLEHGQAVFGPETIVVLAELEMSWPVSDSWVLKQLVLSAFVMHSSHSSAACLHLHRQHDEHVQLQAMA